jgi:hypothetical protein
MSLMNPWTRGLSRAALLAVGLVLLALYLSGTAWAKGYIFITYQDGYMHRIDAANYTLLNSFRISDNKYMAASPDGSWLYLAGNKNISELNTTSFARGTSIPYPDTLSEWVRYSIAVNGFLVRDSRCHGGARGIVGGRHFVAGQSHALAGSQPGRIEHCHR